MITLHHFFVQILIDVLPILLANSSQILPVIACISQCQLLYKLGNNFITKKPNNLLSE